MTPLGKNRIEFSPEALGDLIDLGLRILGFERRAVIAFLVTAEPVTILRITPSSCI